jgi:hypothetical protein
MIRTFLGSAKSTGTANAVSIDTRAFMTTDHDRRPAFDKLSQNMCRAAFSSFNWSILLTFLHDPSGTRLAISYKNEPETILWSTELFSIPRERLGGAALR